MVGEGRLQGRKLKKKVREEEPGRTSRIGAEEAVIWVISINAGTCDLMQ